MARLQRATFALMLALLPACATVIGVVVLAQIPTAAELAGIGLVIAGLTVHQPDPQHPGGAGPDAVLLRGSRRARPSGTGDVH